MPERLSLHHCRDRQKSNLCAGVNVGLGSTTESRCALQCNQGAPGCAVLRNGRYQMVELPKDFGMYECRNVEIYAETVVPSDAIKSDKPDKANKDDIMGEYCLVEKAAQ
jgi:hypothetical protein